MAQFGNLTTDAGLKKLDEHLATRSYVDGFSASGHDAGVYAQLSANVDAAQYKHVARWFSHISYLKSTGRLSAAPVVESKAAPAAETKAAAPAAEAKKPSNDDDFSFDDDDDDTAALEALKKKKAEEDAKKKKEKAPVIARSSVILDVKPIGEETDMAALEAEVRKITMEGLTWCGSELIPVAYGIKLLRIIANVIDEVVSVDDIQDKIQEIEDCQSSDIFAFNKL